MSVINMSAKARPSSDKKVRNQFRNDGYIIANLHGIGGSEGLALEHKPWTTLLKGGSHGLVLELDIDGRKELATIKEVQRNYLGNQIVHIDMVRIDRNKKSRFDVPIHTIGIATGVKDGGVVNLHHQEVIVRATPDLIPSSIQYDITEMALNSKIPAGEIPLPEGVELAMDPHEIIISCDPTRAALGVEATAAAAGAPVAGADTEFATKDKPVQANVKDKTGGGKGAK